MTVDCRTFVARLGTPLAAEDASLANHLAECADCRAAAEVGGLLERTCADPEPRALAGFAARVAARRRERPRASLLPAALAAGTIAAAAAFAVTWIDLPRAPARNALAEAGSTRPETAVDFEELAAGFALDELEWADKALLEGEPTGLDGLFDFSDDEGPI